MDRIWCLKFTSMFPIPGNQLSTYFGNEDDAKAIFIEYSSALSGKLDDAMKVVVFDDLLGRHALRPSFFPHCVMFEIGPSEIAWAEIKKKCDASQRAAGTAQNVGFKSEPNTKEKEAQP